MLLAIDAGNTNVTFAVYDGKKRKALWRIKTDSARTSDEYAAFLLQLFTLKGIDHQLINDAIISSVVPDANFQLRLLCHQLFGKRPLFIGKEIKNVGIQVLTEKPEELGADRLVNTVAVVHYYKTPAIVVDFGTATTFDCVSGEGAFIGGVIAPGVNLSLNALHLAAAKLPKVSVSKPDKAMATNTVMAMQAGIYWGYVELTNGMIKRLSKEMKGKPMVIATGGLAPLFKDDIPSIDKIDDDLTLKGLLTIYHQYKQK